MSVATDETADTPVTADDLWHLGSDTKAMTSTLTALLVEDGTVEWTTTLPELSAVVRVDTRSKQLTVSVEFRAKTVGNVRGAMRIKTNLRETPYLVHLGGKVRKARQK